MRHTECGTSHFVVDQVRIVDGRVQTVAKDGLPPLAGSKVDGCAGSKVVPSVTTAHIEVVLFSCYRCFTQWAPLGTGNLPSDLCVTTGRLVGSGHEEYMFGIHSGNGNDTFSDQPLPFPDLQSEVVGH